MDAFKKIRTVVLFIMALLFMVSFVGTIVAQDQLGKSMPNGVFVARRIVDGVGFAYSLAIVFISITDSKVFCPGSYVDIVILGVLMFICLVQLPMCSMVINEALRPEFQGNAVALVLSVSVCFLQLIAVIGVEVLGLDYNWKNRFEVFKRQ